VHLDVVIVSAGLAVELAGFSSYLRTLLRGESEPHWVSWLVWTLIGAIGTWAAYDGGAGVIGVLVPLSFVAVTFTVLALSCMRSKAIVTRGDLALGAISIATLVAWQTLGLSPGFAATAAVFADGCVVYPTLRKTWLQPASEPLYPWVGAVFAAACGLLVLHDYSYASAAYPAYLLVANATIAAVVVLARPHGPLGHVVP
jgi:hypothetical protein